MTLKTMETKICIVGLGYVGLPLACLLSKKFEVSGFDISQEKINQLKQGIDQTGEIENLGQYKINYSDNPEIISQANFIIACIPTPVDENKKPDLSLLEKASEIIGQNLKPGAVVVYESTVYPGCTEEICLPILEKSSGLKYGVDFKLGYSPERVNPGDKIHTIDKIFKIIAASDDGALNRLKEVYGQITQVYPVSSIKVAEAAKVIENIQRDLNIALANELALIFDRLGINTKEVIEAAGTKWNFHKYYPGLVGGHCIGVDPYYLTSKAESVGYNPKIILAGRGVNESMTGFVASKLKGRKKVLIMGLTFKENVPDIRNSKAKDLALALKVQGSIIYGHDPLLKIKEISVDHFKVELINDWPPKQNFDAIVMFSPHQIFKNNQNYSLESLKKISEPNSILFDLKSFYDKTQAEGLGFKYLTL